MQICICKRLIAYFSGKKGTVTGAHSKIQNGFILFMGHLTSKYRNFVICTRPLIVPALK